MTMNLSNIQPFAYATHNSRVRVTHSHETCQIETKKKKTLKKKNNNNKCYAI